MPKVKCSDSARFRGFVKDFGEKYVSTDERILFCRLCEVKITDHKRFTVQKHCNTAKHKSCVNRALAVESRQRFLFEKPPSSSSDSASSQFCSKDLYKMMVSSNIPLHKVEAPAFKQFFEKYTSYPIPSESTLRKNYLTSCYDDTMKKIRNSVGSNKI